MPLNDWGLRFEGNELCKWYRDTSWAKMLQHIIHIMSLKSKYQWWLSLDWNVTINNYRSFLYKRGRPNLGGYMTWQLGAGIILHQNQCLTYINIPHTHTHGEKLFHTSTLINNKPTNKDKLKNRYIYIYVNQQKFKYLHLYQMYIYNIYQTYKYMFLTICINIRVYIYICV